MKKKIRKKHRYTKPPTPPKPEKTIELIWGHTSTGKLIAIPRGLKWEEATE